MSAILEARDASKRYQEGLVSVVAVDSVSFTVTNIPSKQMT